MLNLMHKDYTIPQIEEVIQDTCRAGIKPGINILLGFPGEGNYEFNETCGFVKRNSRFISYVNVSTLGIEPYTGIYLNIENYGIKMKGSTDWLSRDGTNNFQIRNQRAAILNGIIRQYVNR